VTAAYNRQVDHRDLLRQVGRRPGMYFRGDLNYDKLVVFVVGLDLGTRSGLLDGFREYLILRLNEESSLWWPALALRVTVPEASPWPATDEDDRTAVDGLFGLLDEFLAEFPEGRSRRRLHQEYVLWKQRLSFFNLDLERFRSAPPPEMISIDDAAAALGASRADLFDLIANGTLEVFRAGATLLVRSSRIAQLQAHHKDGPDADTIGTAPG
jgi:hypothetical protein